MPKFTDNQDRQWTVQVDIAAVKRARGLAGVDLLSVDDGKIFEVLAADPVAMCDVLYAVCQPQAETNGVTDEQFGQGLAGDAIADATEALLNALVEFFPPIRRRPLAKVLAKARTVDRRAAELIEARIDSPEMDEMIDAELAKISAMPIRGATSGPSPVSSE